MSGNCYGFRMSDLPEAGYGLYDSSNGVWVGRFFDTREEGEAYLSRLIEKADDPAYAEEIYSIEAVEEEDEEE